MTVLTKLPEAHRGPAHCPCHWFIPWHGHWKPVSTWAFISSWGNHLIPPSSLCFLPLSNGTCHFFLNHSAFSISKKKKKKKGHPPPGQSWQRRGEQQENGQLQINMVSVRETWVKSELPCACVLSHFSHVQLFETLWTITHQAPLSMGILQARILAWVVVPSSRESSQPRDPNRASYVSCIGRQVLYHECHLGSSRTSLSTHKLTYISLSFLMQEWSSTGKPGDNVYFAG